MKKIILLCLVLSLFSEGQAQWKKIFPLDSAASASYRLKKIINAGENHLFAFTKEFPFDHGLFLKSTNAGNTWSTKEFSYQLQDIYCSDSLNLLMLASTGYPDYKGKLLSSSDGGENWFVKIDTLHGPDQISFINRDTAFITCNYNLLKTTDGGASWVNQQLPFAFSFYFLVSSYDANNIIITSQNNNFMKSSDGGNSWVLSPWSIAGTFYDLLYLRPDLIYSSMNKSYPSFEYSSICKSTDGGIIWQRIYSYIFNGNAIGEIQDIDFKDAEYGVGVGRGGHICSTTDGGVSWIVQNSGTEEDLNSIVFTSEKTAYIAGNNIILKTTNFGVTSVQNESKNFPGKFDLLQNYPNPFNPSTTIKYQVSEIGLVTLKVYDILGKEVSSLVNEIKRPGSYDVQFNGSNLSSGVYFYKLNAGAFSTVRKMTLIK